MIYILLTWLISPWLFILHKIGKNREINRVLIIQTAKIGDMLCATPIIIALRQHYPKAQLSVLHAPITKEIIDGLPEVDHCISFDSRNARGFKGRLSLIRLVRQGNYDLLINLSPSLPILLAMLWANVPHFSTIMPTRMGTTLRAIRPLLDDYEQHQEGELILETLGRLLNRRGIALRHRKKMVEKASGEAICDQLGIDRTKNPIGIAISSGNKLKELGEQKLIEIISLLLQKTDRQIVLIGTSEDREIATRILQKFGNANQLIDASGMFCLSELPSLIKRLSVFIGVDSGLTYLADTFNVPIVSVVGPTDPREQRAQGTQVSLIIKRPDCYPCAFVFNAPYFCRTGTRECIINVEAIEIVSRVI